MTDDPLKIDEAKTAFNARAKASMRIYLKSRTLAGEDRLD